MGNIRSTHNLPLDIPMVLRILPSGETDIAVAAYAGLQSALRFHGEAAAMIQAGLLAIAEPSPADEFEAKIATLSEAVAELTAANVALEERVAALTSANGTLEERVAALTSANSTLEERVAALTSANGNLEERVAALTQPAPEEAAEVKKTKSAAPPAAS